VVVVVDVIVVVVVDVVVVVVVVEVTVVIVVDVVVDIVFGNVVVVVVISSVVTVVLAVIVVVVVFVVVVGLTKNSVLGKKVDPSEFVTYLGVVGSINDEDEDELLTDIEVNANTNPSGTELKPGKVGDDGSKK